jgi:hypothetical protein
MEDFLGRLRNTADSMDIVERQKILRLVVKEILIDLETDQDKTFHPPYREQS